MQKLITLFAGLSLILMSCSAQDNSQDDPGENTIRILQLKDVSLQRELPGKRLYIHYCSFCHGESGSGDGLNAWNLDPRPRNFTSADFMKSVTDQQLNDVISRGGKEVGKSNSMPPWASTLTRDEIQQLVDYLRTFSRKDNLK